MHISLKNVDTLFHPEKKYIYIYNFSNSVGVVYYGLLILDIMGCSLSWIANP